MVGIKGSECCRRNFHNKFLSYESFDAYLEIILVIINRDDGRILLSLDLALLKHSCHLVLLIRIDLGGYLRRAR